MTISAFDIACWVSAGNLLKSFDDMVLYMYFSCPRYEVRKKESVDLEIRGVFPWCFKKYTPRRNNHVKKSDLFGNPGCFFFQNTPDTGKHAFSVSVIFFSLEVFLDDFKRFFRSDCIIKKIKTSSQQSGAKQSNTKPTCFSLPVTS